MVKAKLGFPAPVPAVAPECPFIRTSDLLVVVPCSVSVISAKIFLAQSVSIEAVPPPPPTPGIKLPLMIFGAAPPLPPPAVATV